MAEQDTRNDQATVAPAAEVDTFEDALEAGYFGHAPGKDNDHTLAGVTATAPGEQPAGEPEGTDNGGNAGAKRSRAKK